jgi:peptide/nickel transport system permease protein/oligopeptide transport system permease protein
LLGVTLIIFIMMRAIPGDPARVILGFDAPQQQVEDLRREMGLDQPWPVQYGIFVYGLVRGDFGVSAHSKKPVTEIIAQHWPYTAQLAIVGTSLGALFGVSLGVLAATKRDTLLDYLVSTLSVAGVSMPVYWLGLLLISVFAIQLGILPAAGASSGPQSILLPAFSVAIHLMALVARMTRGTMMDELRQDYVRTARAKGLAPRVVVFKHALRNAAMPIVTVIGLQLGVWLARHGPGAHWRHLHPRPARSAGDRRGLCRLIYRHQSRGRHAVPVPEPAGEILSSSP